MNMIARMVRSLRKKAKLEPRTTPEIIAANRARNRQDRLIELGDRYMDKNFTDAPQRQRIVTADGYLDLRGTIRFFERGDERIVRLVGGPYHGVFAIVKHLQNCAWVVSDCSYMRRSHKDDIFDWHYDDDDDDEYG